MDPAQTSKQVKQTTGTFKTRQDHSINAKHHRHGAISLQSQLQGARGIEFKGVLGLQGQSALQSLPGLHSEALSLSQAPHPLKRGWPLAAGRKERQRAARRQVGRALLFFLSAPFVCSAQGIAITRHSAFHEDMRKFTDPEELSVEFKSQLQYLLGRVAMHTLYNDTKIKYDIQNHQSSVVSYRGRCSWLSTCLPLELTKTQTAGHTSERFFPN